MQRPPAMNMRKRGEPKGREAPRGPQRLDDGNAFLPDTVGQNQPIAVPDAESFAEEFIGSATRGEPVYESAHEEVAEDEDGGPFIVLDEEAQLPPEPEEPGIEHVPEAETETETETEPAEAEAERAAPRGANWAARGV